MEKTALGEIGPILQSKPGVTRRKGLANYFAIASILLLPTQRNVAFVQYFTFFFTHKRWKISDLHWDRGLGRSGEMVGER